MWFCFSMLCAYTLLSCSLFAFDGNLGFCLFLQSQRRRFEIGKNGGPALFTESFDRGTLGGLPGRRQFLELFPAFGCDRKFHPIASSAADSLHETIPLQGSKIPHECP